MPKKSQTAKPPTSTKDLRLKVTDEFSRVITSVLQAPPYNGGTVQDLLLSALLHYVPHEQWQRAAAHACVEPRELVLEGVISQSARQPSQRAAQR